MRSISRILAIFALAITAGLPAPARSHGGSHRSYSSRRTSETHVRSYTTRRGTYVAPHYRSHEDSSFANNWSTKGNRNPHTGKWGTKIHR